MSLAVPVLELLQNNELHVLCMFVICVLDLKSTAFTPFIVTEPGVALKLMLNFSFINNHHMRVCIIIYNRRKYN